MYDVDGDGFDEVFIGSALIDHDGQVMWRTEGFDAHSDTACIVEHNGEIRFISLDSKLRCMDKHGGLVWSRQCGHGQHMVPGRYFKDDARPGFAVIDILAGENGESLSLYDWDGNNVWRRTPGSQYKTCHICGIEWASGDLRSILLFSETPQLPVLVYDAGGTLIDSIALDESMAPENATMGYSFASNLLGGYREQVVTVSSRFINIFQNTAPNQKCKQYNMTYYPGV